MRKAFSKKASFILLSVLCSLPRHLSKFSWSGLCRQFLFLLVTALLSDSSSAQGILPASKDSSSASTPTHVLIGQVIPKTLTMVDAEGKTQPLLSLKLPTQVMVIGFYSPKC